MLFSILSLLSPFPAICPTIAAIVSSCASALGISRDEYQQLPQPLGVTAVNLL